MAELTPYESWQLTKFGNIVKESNSILQSVFTNEEDTGLTTAEDNYIFLLTEQNI